MSTNSTNLSLPILDNLQIASPCTADWEQMTGDERARFCGLCQLNVYNLSGMTRGEAEELIRTKEGKLCVRFFRRPDGTVLTQDCPVGWAAVRQKMIRSAVAIATLAASFLGGMFAWGMSSSASSSGRSSGGIFSRWTRPSASAVIGTAPPPAMGNVAVMGGCSAPPMLGKIAMPQTPIVETAIVQPEGIPPRVPELEPVSE